MPINLLVQNLSDPHKEFRRMAHDLMNGCILTVGENRYRIASLEFYFTIKGHEDKYTHQHQKQLTCGEWYFHGSGLDITFGGKDQYGGILIQAIQTIDSNDFIGGPLKVVTELIGKFGDINSKAIKFGLEPFEHVKEDIFECERVGLNASKDDVHFRKPYRFLIMPKKGHTKKGQIINYLVGVKGMDRKEAERKIYA